MKKFFPIQIIDLRYQVDHITTKKIKLFEEHRAALNDEELIVILIKHRQIKMISDGH